jgi:hypothetical protein
MDELHSQQAMDSTITHRGGTTLRGATNTTAFIENTKIILYGKWLVGRIGSPKMNSAIAIR